MDSIKSQLDIKIMELSEIHGSRGWRTVLLVRRISDAVFPRGSFRRKMAVSAFKFCGTVFRYAVKVKRSVNHCKKLIIKAFYVLRKRGASVLIRKTIAYMARRNGSVARMEGLLVPDANRMGNVLFKRQQEELSMADMAAMIEGFKKKPLISVIMPIYNTPPKWLKAAIESMRSQIYENWELCAVDDYSSDDGVRETLKHCSDTDSRIKIRFSEKNGGISAASNASLGMAKGEYVALFDHDDELTKDALFWMVKEINDHPGTEFVYSDECKIDDTEKRRLYEFIFKPDWSPEMLLNCAYTGHFTVYKKSLVVALGGFRSAYDFSQDYDLALRASERAEDIRHVERVLYLWRAIPGSAARGGKEYARKSNLAALGDAMKRREVRADIMEYSWTNRAKIRSEFNDKVSIIIPSDSRDNLLRVVDALIRKTSYMDFEIIAVTNSRLIAELNPARVGDLKNLVFSPYDKEYNFSDKCNQGSKDASGKILVFLNDDVYPITDDWLDNLIEFLYLDDKIGGVSPKLLLDNGSIQYAGMTTNANPFIGTFLNGRHRDEGLANMVRNTSILSGACLAIKKEVFLEVGGFDCENTPTGHSDLDLSFRLREGGYRCVYTPYASLHHMGNCSWHAERDKADIYVLSRWGKYMSYDPYFTKSMRAELEGYLPDQFGIFSSQSAAKEHSFDALIVAYELSVTGAPVMALNIAQAIAKAGGYPVVYAYIDGPLRAEFEKADIPVIINRLAMDDGFSFKHFAKNFDVAIVNTVAAYPAVCMIQDIVPTIWYIHEAKSIESLFIPDFGMREPSLSEALRDTRAAVYVASEYSRDAVSRYADDVKILRYGFRDLYKGKEARVDKKIRFSIVGTVVERKAQDVFIDAILRMPEAHRRKAVFNIIGDDKTYGSFADDLKRKTKDIPEIVWHGLIADQKRKSDLFTEASAFVVISRDEPTSIVAIEGAMLGRPSIISKDVGARYLIEDGKTGFVVKTGDSEGLRKIFMKIIDHPEILIPMGEKARERYLETSTFDIFRKNLMEAIKEKMKESDRGSDDVFIERRLYGKTGIEIGGPSEAFKELLPIYRAAKKIDGVNFSEKTLWDSRKAGRDSFAYYEGKRGDQYILEATKLDGIADDSYDFLLASHSLEHIANPIKALKEWIRVVKPGGTIVVIVPNKEACFDHKRDYTSFEHILNDYERDIGEDDLTHLDEILEKHDLSMDTPAGTFKQFKERSLRNFSNRALHQHVFSPESLERVFDFLGISVEKSFVDGLNIVCIGRVPDKRS